MSARLRTLVVLLAASLAATLAAPSLARADSYVWGGTVGRLSVSVHRLGFLEGAGTEGWEPESARRFATWGAHINALIPRDRRVVAVFGLEDDSFRLEIRDRADRPLDVLETPIRSIELADAEYEALTGMIRRYFGGAGSASPPRAQPPRARPIYTVQLAATRDRRAAEELAHRLRERGVAASGSFYHETCAPCLARDPKVLEGDRAGRAAYRVVTGVFRSWRTATRARRRLERDTNRRAFVRRL